MENTLTSLKVMCPECGKALPEPRHVAMKRHPECNREYIRKKHQRRQRYLKRMRRLAAQKEGNRGDTQS